MAKVKVTLDYEEQPEWFTAVYSGKTLRVLNYYHQAGKPTEAPRSSWRSEVPEHAPQWNRRGAVAPINEQTGGGIKIPLGTGGMTKFILPTAGHHREHVVAVACDPQPVVKEKPKPPSPPLSPGYEEAFPVAGAAKSTGASSSTGVLARAPGRQGVNLGDCVVDTGKSKQGKKATKSESASKKGNQEKEGNEESLWKSQ